MTRIRSLLYPLLIALALLGLLGSQRALALSQDDLLPAEDAFATTLTRDADTFRLTFKVAPGYYLYRSRIQLQTEPPGQLQATPLPAGKHKEDPFFGPQQIYTGTLTLALPLKPGTPADTRLKVSLQGCADVGVCYPPATRTLTPDDGKRSALGDWLRAPAAPSAAQATPALGEDGLALTLATFFIAGLGMALTACMYPLIPIVSSLIAGQGQTLTRARALLLALAYVQGLALTYTAIGVVAGLTGQLLTVWLQQPAVVLSASVLLIVFALSMFDLFAIQLPVAWQSRLADSSNRLGGGRLASVALMGALSALLIGPCVAPPLALALGYIGASGDALLGGAALYAMAMGLGLPLLLLGVFGGHILPRAGAWMKAVKAVFGVVMLALAIRLATPFLPPAWVLGAWALLAIGCAVFLRAFEPLPSNARAPHKLGKALGLILFLLGAAQLVGMLAGARDARAPLAAFVAAPAASAAPRQAWQAIDDSAELDAALARARAAGQPAILDFYADWCASCIELEEKTFATPAVQDALAPYLRLRADVTANSAAHQALYRRFGLFGPPGVIVFDADGNERTRLVGFAEPDAFLARLHEPGR